MYEIDSKLGGTATLDIIISEPTETDIPEKSVVEIERITEQIVILHHGRLLALGNLHAIREKMDNIPHRIDIGCDSPKGLAKSVIDIDSVHGIIFQHPEKLTVQTRNLGDFHSNLPKTIIDGGHKVISIDNPDDDLASILGYLTGGGGF